MEKKIDIAAILKDCPRGMELGCTTWFNVTFEKVVNDEIYIKRNNKTPSFNNIIILNQYGCVTNHKDEKCRIFPKGKTTWEGFQRPFKSGDIVCYMDAIAIFKEWGDETLFRTYVATYSCIDSFIDVNIPFYGKNVRKEIRLATEKEKEKLFRAIEENGYKWNEKTKTLVKKPTFKNGDILYVDANDRRSDDDRYKYIFIFEETVGRDKEEIYGRKVMAHCYMTVNGYFKPKNVYLIDDNIYPIRFATEEEKQKLFQIIKDNDYKWDEKTKTLEKSIKPKFKVGDKIVNDDYVVEIIDMDIEGEVYGYKSKMGGIGGILFIEQDEWELVPDKFDFTTLKPFDKVLVRGNNHKWKIQFFEKFDEKSIYPFVCMDGRHSLCIPYNGNEYLHDTTNSCSDYYRI